MLVLTRFGRGRRGNGTGYGPRLYRRGLRWRRRRPGRHLAWGRLLLYRLIRRLHGRPRGSRHRLAGRLRRLLRRRGRLLRRRRERPRGPCHRLVDRLRRLLYGRGGLLRGLRWLLYGLGRLLCRLRWLLYGPSPGPSGTACRRISRLLYRLRWLLHRLRRLLYGWLHRRLHRRPCRPGHRLRRRCVRPRHRLIIGLRRLLHRLSRLVRVPRHGSPGHRPVIPVRIAIAGRRPVAIDRRIHRPDIIHVVHPGRSRTG